MHCPPKIVLSRPVNSIKGVLWSLSYFAASCDGALLAITTEYIDNQE